jgi:hypothetical protein
MMTKLSAEMSRIVRLKKLPANLLQRVSAPFCHFSTQCHIIIIIIIIIIVYFVIVYDTL